MKKTALLKLSALMMSFFGATSLTQAANLEVADFEMYQGATALMPLDVQPDAGGMFQYKGFQFDLKLPSGITVDLEKTTAMTGFTFQGEVSADGNARIVAFTQDETQSVTVTSGLMQLGFKAAYDATVGPNEVEISNVIFSSPKGVDIMLDGSDFTITILKTEIKAESIVVEPHELELSVEETYKLEATISPENVNVKDVKWESSNPSIATVSPYGIVTAVSLGECVITATTEDGTNLSDKCVVTVVPKFVPVQSIVVNPDELYMYVGDEPYSLTATVTPDDATNRTVVWSTENENIATVDENGKVTPVGPGTCKVYATVENATAEGESLSAYCVVTVSTREPEVIPVTSITVEPSEVEMYVGEQPRLLTAIIEPADATNQTVVWTSSDEKVATVDEAGYVTAVAPGKCVVTATTTDGTNLSGTCQVTVLEKAPEVIPVETLTVSPSELEMTEGDDPFMLEAIITPDNATNKDVVWSSSNPDVATVDQAGYVTAVAPGTCVVTATTDATVDGTLLSGTCNVTVLAKEEPGPVIPETPTVPTTPIPDGWTGNGNGTYVYPVKIREGNELSLGVNEPTGGYEDAFKYAWTAPDNAAIGSEPEIETTARLYGAAASAGVNQTVSSNVYNVQITNYGPQNEVFWQATYPTATVQVYKRPQIPTQLLRKGDGSSCTFVVMMTPLSNEQILELGYSYTYGYTDQSGTMHVLDTTDKRYTHTTSEIYNNASYTFWAYSQWTYADGSVITSGLRYLNGGEDPDFDASSISGTRGGAPASSGVDAVEAEEDILGIYTLDGRYMGTDASALERGIYIIRTNNSAKKVIL